MGDGAEDFQQEEAGADDDAGVGDVEVGPVVVVDADGEEVDDVVETDAVVEVAEGSAEDEGEGDRGGRELTAREPEQREDDDGRDHGEGDEADADGVGWHVFQQAEGRAGVDDMRETEDTGDDGNVVAGTDAADDRDLGEAVGEDDERGEEEEEGAAVGGELQVAGCQFQALWSGTFLEFSVAGCKLLAPAQIVDIQMQYRGSPSLRSG